MLIPGFAAAEMKMGVVNVAKIMEESPQAVQASKKLKREFEPREKELIKTNEQLLKMETELKKNAAIMSDRERRKKERELISGRRELKRARDELREDFALRNNEELGKLQRKILEAIDSLAQAEKFDLVLDRQGVYYVRSALDITDKVLVKLRSLHEAVKSK